MSTQKSLGVPFSLEAHLFEVSLDRTVNRYRLHISCVNTDTAYASEYNDEASQYSPVLPLIRIVQSFCINRLICLFR